VYAELGHNNTNCVTQTVPQNIAGVWQVHGNVGVFSIYFLGQSGTKSTITEATKWPIIPAPDDDDDDDNEC
jgi:hypothetical protein